MPNGTEFSGISKFPGKKDNLKRWTEIFETNFQKFSVPFHIELKFAEILVGWNTSLSSIRCKCIANNVMGSLHNPVTWYKITQSWDASLRSGTSKTKTDPGELVRVALFWKSHCATCLPLYVILYHVNGSCKEPIGISHYLKTALIEDFISFLDKLSQPICPLEARKHVSSKYGNWYSEIIGEITCVNLLIGSTWHNPVTTKQLFTVAILLYRFLSCWCLERSFT